VRVRVKICGITAPDAARAAADAGADAVGLVFAESPRRVTPQAAAEIVRALPPWVTAVGVFVDAPADEVRTVAAAVGLTTVQLHGDESPDAMAALGDLKIIKAFRIGSEADVAAARAWRNECERLGRWPDAYLVDAHVVQGPKGGTGRPADWHLAARLISEDGLRPLILAGGLGPDNVAEAVRQVRPGGVEGSSRLEAGPGRKDPAKVRAFLEAVRCVG